MKAIRDHENLFVLKIPDPTDPQREIRAPNTPRFTLFYGIFGWPDLAKQGPYAQTWFTVLGKQEDSRYSILAEIGGDLGDVAKHAIDYKDIFLLDLIIVDYEDKEAIRFLRDPQHCDGLTSYHWETSDEDTGMPQYTHLGTHWKHFRDDKPYEVMASLVPVRDTIKLNVSSGYDRLVAMAKTEDEHGNPRQADLIITPSCQESISILRSRSSQIRRDIIEHPLTRALVYGIQTMEVGRPGPDIERRPPWYGNL